MVFTESLIHRFVQDQQQLTVRLTVYMLLLSNTRRKWDILKLSTHSKNPHRDGGLRTGTEPAEGPTGSLLGECTDTERGGEDGGDREERKT